MHRHALPIAECKHMKPSDTFKSTSQSHRTTQLGNATGTVVDECRVKLRSDLLY